LNSAKRRVETLQVTGNPDEDKLWWAYVYAFNGGTCEPAKIYQIIRRENEDWVAPSKFIDVFQYLESLPAMRRVLTADESKLVGAWRPPLEPSTCGVAAGGGSGGALVDLDEVDNDVAIAAALVRLPGRRQGRKSRRSATEEFGNNQSVEQSAAAISTISGAISGFIEAKGQKMS
jgi:hypothetical protein